MANDPKKPAPPAAPAKPRGRKDFKGSDAETLVDLSVDKLNEQLEELEAADAVTPTDGTPLPDETGPVDVPDEG